MSRKRIGVRLGHHPWACHRSILLSRCAYDRSLTSWWSLRWLTGAVESVEASSSDTHILLGYERLMHIVGKNDEGNQAGKRVSALPCSNGVKNTRWT